MNRSVYLTAMKLACSIYFALLFSFNPAFSQDKSDPFQQPEKIYLQLDGKVYTTNQTIWFKAIVTDIDHAPTLLSGVLHVEFIGPDELVVDHKLLKLDDGIGHGEFELTENYKTGRYLIRAYTEWNKNFGDDFIFQEYVDVFPSSLSGGMQAIDNLYIDKSDSAKHRMSATLNPFVLDSLHSGNLNVHLILDGKKDSLAVRKSNKGSYVLDYELPGKSHIVTISIKSDNGESFTKTFSVNTEDIDLQFFPEGGELIHGLASKVGFKALDYAGKGKTVEGVVADAEGHVIADFKSNELGMGSFFLRADSSKGYHAVLKDHPAEKYPLPHVKSKGWTLNIRKPEGNFTIAVASSVQQMDSVYIRLSCREKEYGFLKGRMRDGGLLWSPDKESLPEGVIIITILDKNMRPVAERLFFNERQDTRADLRLHTDRSVYVQREKTSVTVKVNDIGFDEKADVSMLVINKEQMGPLQSTRENILSYFLLSSDLKGEIENPGYYFRKENANRLTDLDVLMLTQGWRKFKYTESDSIHFQPEYNISISGSVGGVLSKKNKKEGVALTLMTFKEPVFVKSQTTDSLGRFHFDVPDRYDERLNFTVQSANQKGENKDYQVLLDEKISPPISYRQSPEMIDSVVSLLVEKHRDRKLIEDAYRLSGVNYLDEVKIKATRIIPEREKVTEKYGEADVVIDGEAIQAKEQKWSFGLYSVLMHYFPEEINIRRIGGRNSYLYASIIGWWPTLVIIDGITVKGYEYPNIPDIPPSEVRSFELIKRAKIFGKVFREAFPSAREIPPRGSLIAIYTYAGKGLAGTSRAPGLSKMSIPVFTPVREFYAPHYEKLSPEDWVKPDNRALIHWSPQTSTDDNGEATISFYNADVTGDVMVVVEAITDHGRIGYQEMVYGVKKR